MHQHPRPPPVTASPANSERTNPTRTNNPRDRDLNALRTNQALPQSSGSSEDFASARQDQPADNPVAQMQRLNQVIQNFHTKSALIILQSRVELPPAYSQKTDARRVNRWFNLDIDETDEYREDIKRWKTCDVEYNRPPPLIIEIFLSTESLHQSQRLVIVDEDGKRWDVMNTLSSAQSTSRTSQRRPTESTEVLLERWTIELGDSTTPIPSDLVMLLPLIYKKSIVFFRSLYTYTNFLPAWKLSRKIGKGRSHMALKLGYRIVAASQLGGLSRHDNLKTRLFDGNSDVLLSYDFGKTESPAGPFSVRVDYRQNCDFRIDDSEELLSSRFLGAGDDMFPPSVPLEIALRTEVGSLPSHRRNTSMDQETDLGQAYGSLTSFHQAGVSGATDPISALRNARDFDSSSPPTPEQSRPPFPPAQTSKTSLRAVAANRRSSFSVQPFKTPTLSASPLGVSPMASSPRTSARVPTLGSLTEEGIPPPAAPVTLAGRRAGSIASDNAIASSASTSPRPSGVRYSSSFSHRRARLSSGGTTTRTDEDQTSSGRGSTASSAQPGSGLMTEPTAGAGTSSGSMGEDDGENISSFLKMLEQQKDLLSPASSTAAEANTRRTTAALNRFHRMRDSNAVLSDSMSSSMMMQRSSASSSRQLSGVPPMVTGTSISTSSSPGKPISPHTPHTPFAPSRLSAAYSHDDTEEPHRLMVEEPPSPSEAATEETAHTPSTANAPPIPIPNSPTPFYQRSNSAQRRPLSSGEDIDDLYGTRSRSMGADRRGHRREPAQQDDGAPQTDVPLRRESIGSPRQPSQVHRPSGLATAVTNESDTHSAERSSSNVYASKGARGSGGRLASQGSTSTTSGAGASVGPGSSSASVTWRGRGSGSRPENRFDDDDMLPFAMERSDFNPSKTGHSGSEN
jgi:autophagy-related protein 13